MVLKYPVHVALNPFASTIGYLLPSVFSGAVIVAAAEFVAAAEPGQSNSKPKFQSGK